VWAPVSLPGTYGTLEGPADHEAAIRQFTPDSFPQEWIPLMAQQMAQAPPSRWEGTWDGSGARGGTPGGSLPRREGPIIYAMHMLYSRLHSR